MNHARLFTLLVAVALMVYGMIGFYFLPLASFEGDLTRMAMLPEEDFGWRQAQPAIDPKLMESVPWQEADVVAIGDSFTTSKVWQTELAQRGLRVHTESWANVYSLCSDLGGWMRRQGFKGRQVVIESAEKYLEGRLAQSVDCHQMNYHPLPEQPTQPPLTQPDRTHGEYGGSLSVGLLTARNQYRYHQLANKPDFNRLDGLGEVYLVRLPDGCELFSHKQCGDVLFYQKDRRDDMGENVLADMAEINRRLNGFDVVWMVVPDKATVYLPGHKQFWNEAERRFRAPNLLRVLQRAVEQKTVDLYYANNTHVSPRGYQLLGRTIYERLQH